MEPHSGVRLPNSRATGRGSIKMTIIGKTQPTLVITNKQKNFDFLQIILQVTFFIILQKLFRKIKFLNIELTKRNSFWPVLMISKKI